MRAVSRSANLNLAAFLIVETIPKPSGVILLPHQARPRYASSIESRMEESEAARETRTRGRFRAKFKSWLKGKGHARGSKSPQPTAFDPGSIASKDDEHASAKNEPPMPTTAENSLRDVPKPKSPSVLVSGSSTPMNAETEKDSTPDRPESVGGLAVRRSKSPSVLGDPVNGDPWVERPIAELWNLAYEELREKEPKLIKRYEKQLSSASTMAGSTVTISDLGKVHRKEQMEILVKRKLEEDENGGWMSHFSDDRIAMRDLARSVISIISWGKDFVGDALQASPYTAIAWAGVCLLLPVSYFQHI